MPKIIITIQCSKKAVEHLDPNFSNLDVSLASTTVSALDYEKLEREDVLVALGILDKVSPRAEPFAQINAVVYRTPKKEDLLKTLAWVLAKAWFKFCKDHTITWGETVRVQSTLADGVRQPVEEVRKYFNL
ncbi:hypothetical protein ACFL13_00640 [Patescibacteria group bacterium]